MRGFAVRQLRTVALLTILCGGAATGTAFADAVQAGVTIPAGQPTPVMTENGTGYTPGTYAIGTIQLNYTTVGTTFPTGPFAVFQLNLGDFLTSGKTPEYPVSLGLNQIGGDILELTPSLSPVQVSGIGWNSSVLVTISIPSSVAADPTLNEDGDELVAKLQLRADSAHLKTPTDILVKIRLVHPTACLKVYDFITDASLANTITSTEVNVNNKGKVTSTNPYGSLSHNVLVVNTCGTVESFDLRVYLDAWFSTQPSNNPGNAVFTFITAGEIDEAAFNIAAFGAGTAQGQNLCLQNVTVPAGSTFLATVHTSINNGWLASSLPSSKVFTGFTSTLTTSGASCGGAAISIATPNPASAPLAFSIK
jgi:hypothetical protein